MTHFFGNDSSGESDGGFWSTVHDVCVDMAHPIGAATDWMYTTIANRGLPDQAAAAVGDFAGGFVEHNWPNVCDLPANVSTAINND